MTKAKPTLEEMLELIEQYPVTGRYTEHVVRHERWGCE